MFDKIKSDAITGVPLRGHWTDKTTIKNYDKINASSEVVGKYRVTVQIVLSALK